MSLFIERSMAIPVLLIVIGASWLMSCQWIAGDFPPNRDVLHWLWLLVLAIAGLVALVVRRCDKGSVVVCLVALLACVPLVCSRFPGELTVDVLDFAIPLPIIAVGVVLLAVQLSARAKPVPEGVSRRDPLAQPVRWLGCAITLAGLAFAGMSVCVVFANGMAMEGRQPDIEHWAIIAASASWCIALAGCITALLRRSP